MLDRPAQPALAELQLSSLMMQNLWVLSSRTNELIQVTPSGAGRVKLHGGPPG
jgi:hypothetical protein